MAGIHALSETIVDQAGGNEEFSEGVALIKQNARQASQLVHRIINLHQGKTGESNYHNLNEITADLADLVRKVIPRRMELVVELAAEALPVYLDVVEFRQVVINLVLNAIDAMPQKGRLVLRTSGFTMGSVNGIKQSAPSVTSASQCSIPLTDPIVMVGALPHQPVARLSVEDNGCGIKPLHLSNVFEPFFTTKPMNKASGLGLYNARLFIDKHRGAITVESKEGIGSTFHLWLPQADFTEAAAESSSTPKDDGPASPPVGGNTGGSKKLAKDF
jgi:two-component system cell cycle sensor histidine kinase/response regulator CckA